MTESDIEAVARDMYWDRVNPHLGHITLDVAVRHWEDLPDVHIPGRQVWHAKDFWIKAAQSAIAALEQRGWGKIPDGWQIVPKEPTEEMVKAYGEAVYFTTDTRILPQNIWEAMLAAAPLPTKGGER